ncbi:MAG: hypothetical protein KDD46_05130 [Bdellovibrionales bacterium]|nr:hypothetical protein [Bdellovibrionales bacterium]
MKKFMIIILSILIPSASFAASTIPAMSPSLNRKVRNLGMGNVGVSILGTHDSSAFYNPAGLNDLEDAQWRFLTITAEIGSNAFGLIGDAIDFGKDIDDANSDDERINVLNQFIQDRSGEFQYTRLNLELINYTRKNFAVGLVFDERLDMSFRNQAYPNFDMRTIGDVTAYLAFAQGFLDGGLQVGMTFKPTVRFALDEADQQITYSDVSTENADGDPIILDQFKNIYDQRQFRIPVDIGFKSKLAAFFDSDFMETFDPMIGLAWQDVGSMNFAPSQGNTQTLNFGVSLNPKLGRIQNSWAVELRGLNLDRPLISKLHIGAELKLPWILAVRGGLSQGYLTGGLTVDLRFFSIDAAIYSEEIGLHTREDGNLRYAATANFKI